MFFILVPPIMAGFKLIIFWFLLFKFLLFNEILSTLKPDDIYQLICEKAKSSAEEKQVFISAYLQDLHIYLSAIPGLSVPRLNLTKEMEFDCSKLCRNCTEPLLHQHDNKPVCNCNRNFTISRACIDLQYYQPINLAFKGKVLILTLEMLFDYGLVYQLICSDPSQASNFGRKINLSLTQGFKLNKKFVDAIFISKAPEWISRGNILPS